MVEVKVWPAAAHRDPGAPGEALTPEEEEALPPPEWSEADLPELESAEWELLTHELEGNAVAMRAADGYINATAMCRAAGKLFADFYRLSATEAYFTKLSAVMGIPITELTLIRQGGRPLEQGTWIHPLASHALAMDPLDADEKGVISIHTLGAPMKSQAWESCWTKSENSLRKQRSRRRESLTSSQSHPYT